MKRGLLAVSPFAVPFALVALAACGAPGAGASSSSGASGRTSGTSARSLVCEGSPAPAALERGLCVCGDLADVGGLRVERGRPDAPVAAGVNGQVKIVSDAAIDGALVAFGGLDATAELTVAGDLVTAGDAHFVGKLAVGGDLDVGGSLDGVGELAVGGAARVAGAHEVVGSELAWAPFTTPVAEPCGCDPATFVDVPAIVRLAARQNENAAHGLGTHLGDVGDAALTLESGAYYFDDAAAVGTLALHVDGMVAIYLEGDLDLVGAGTIDLTPGSTLDLYVAGDVHAVGDLAAGSDDPSAVRLFIGGSAPVKLATVGTHTFRGALHAPTATLEYVGDTVIEGAVLAGSIDGVGTLTVRQWSPVEALPSDCTGPAAGEGGEGAPSDGSTGGDGANDPNSPERNL